METIPSQLRGYILDLVTDILTDKFERVERDLNKSALNTHLTHELVKRFEANQVVFQRTVEWSEIKAKVAEARVMSHRQGYAEGYDAAAKYFTTVYSPGPKVNFFKKLLDKLSR